MNREPELVVTDPQGENGRTLTQAFRTLGVKTLAEVQAETPLLDVPSPPSSLSPALFAGVGRTSPLSSLGASFSRTKPVEQWSLEERQRYNQMVERYYGEYGSFLDERTEWVRLVLRSFDLSLSLENIGTAPATGIDVDVYFPETVLLFEADEFEPPPKPPEPPPVQPPGIHMARIHQPTFNMDLGSPFRQRSTLVIPEERRVRFSSDGLKHNHIVSFDDVRIAFKQAEDIGPITAKFIITANEPIDPIRGEIPFAIALEPDESGG